jgi:amidase
VWESRLQEGGAIAPDSSVHYNQLREGVTAYLPVYVPGALLFVGDGHAAQGAGELTGNALETSAEVTRSASDLPASRA